MRHEPLTEAVIAWARKWGLRIGFDVKPQSTAHFAGPWMHGINWDGSIYVHRTEDEAELARNCAALAHEIAHVMHTTNPEDTEENELLGIERAIHRECGIPYPGWWEWMNEYQPATGSAEWWFLTPLSRRRYLRQSRALAVSRGILDEKGRSTFRLPTDCWWNRPL